MNSHPIVAQNNRTFCEQKSLCPEQLTPGEMLLLTRHGTFLWLRTFSAKETMQCQNFLPVGHVTVEFLRTQGSQSVGCECVATYSGRPAAARLFIRQWQWQHSSAKLLSWRVVLSWVLGTFTLVYLGLRTGWDMQLAYSSHVTAVYFGESSSLRPVSKTQHQVLVWLGIFQLIHR